MPTLIERRPDGEIIVVAGTSGSGKTLYAMRRAAPASRLLVWDSHLQWSACGAQAIPKLTDLARACGTREPAHLAYTGPADRAHFLMFCRIALCWIKLAPATIVIEEWGDVAPSGKAPGAWGELVRWVRKLGAILIAICQRPSETDKTTLRNAHRIVCHAVRGEADQKYMAKELGVPIEQVAAIDIGQLEHLERAPDHTITRGRTSKTPRNSRAKSRSL
jgi:hypothetical protein